MQPPVVFWCIAQNTFVHSWGSSKKRKDYAVSRELELYLLRECSRCCVTNVLRQARHTIQKPLYKVRQDDLQQMLVIHDNTVRMAEERALKPNVAKRTAYAITAYRQANKK